MSLLAIKYLHIGCAVVSYLLFFIRGIWMLQSSTRLQQRWVKIVPHVIDTVLLASAITLAWQLALSPFDAPWLLAKIIALLLYIVLGTYALKRGKTLRMRLGCWIAAQLVFLYIVLTAINHNPALWF